MSWRYKDSKTGRARFAPAKNERREFPEGERGLVFCGSCGIVYYKKAWHHSTARFSAAKKDVSVLFRLCPACIMIRGGQFEGHITVRSVPAAKRTLLRDLVRGYGRRAWERDPLDRVIDASYQNGTLVVTTTENQLAQKLAKKIMQTFKGARARIVHMPHPSDVVHADILFSR